jgi:hypothetical protein
MGGCTNCGSKVGCDHRKGAMLASVDAALAALYPTRTWGQADDALGDGLVGDELYGLADELASELAAATFVREGDDREPCDYIYVLCMGRAPCVVQVRDHGVAVPVEWGEHVDGTALPFGSADGRGRAPAVDGRIGELYLRVVVSQRARVAAVQQVAIDATRTESGWIVRETPRAGVYDAPLLHRMQKLVAILPAYELLHVDFGEIAHAPPGFHAGTWRELFGGEPAIANYLFYPQPTTMVATMLLEGA